MSVHRRCRKSSTTSILPETEACAFCVGYLNLRGWGQLADFVEHLPGGDERHACRLLIGMHRAPEEEMKALSGLRRGIDVLDGPTLARLKRRITESFKTQLEFGVPTDGAEAALHCLAQQLRARKVLLKAFLRHPLYAKLYLMRRQDAVVPHPGRSVAPGRAQRRRGRAGRRPQAASLVRCALAR